MDDDGELGIIVFNDDQTPMEFVVGLLTDVFGCERPAAIETMLRIHRTGFAVVQVLPRAAATSRLKAAREHIEASSMNLVVRLIDDPAHLLPATVVEEEEAPPGPIRRLFMWLARFAMLAVIVLVILQIVSR